MTAPDDLIRRGDVLAMLNDRIAECDRTLAQSKYAVDIEDATAERRELSDLVTIVAALPADPVAEAAEAEIVRLRAIEAEAKTYLANMDYCFTAENLTVEDEGHRDASESRLRALLAKGGAA